MPYMSYNLLPESLTAVSSPKFRTLGLRPLDLRAETVGRSVGFFLAVANRGEDVSWLHGKNQE